MRQCQFWESIPPSPQALSSPNPFCVDTLTFPQWLQFVFIPRVKVIIEEQQPLPSNSDIVPMAEEWFGKNAADEGKRVIATLAEFDALINNLDA